jgi:hypothetical protein
MVLPREVSLPIHWCVFDFSQVLRGCSTQQKGVGKNTKKADARGIVTREL